MILWKPKKKKTGLDVYKNNLVMGFSYHKLLSIYNGYCCKVRRSSDNATMDFGFVKKKYVNLAKNATISGSSSINNVGYINNMALSTTQYAGLNDINLGWFKFDLGSVSSISNINFWHLYDGRIYHDVIVQISVDNTNWTNIFNNDSNNSAGQGIGSDAEYIDNINGKKLTLNQNARYIRFWSNGSNISLYNHLSEVEILTTTNEWYIDIDSILAFCGTGNGYVHTWYNQYASGNNAIQTTTNIQPMIVNSGIFEYNGLNMLSNRFLVINDYSAIKSQIFYLYVNLYQLDFTNYYTFAFKGKSDGGELYSFQSTLANKYRVFINTGTYSTFNSLTQNTGNNKIVLSYKNRNASLLINGVSQDSGISAGDITYSDGVFRISNTYEPFNGNIKSVIFFNDINVDYNKIKEV